MVRTPEDQLPQLLQSVTSSRSPSHACLTMLTIPKQQQKRWHIPGKAVGRHMPLLKSQCPRSLGMTHGKALKGQCRGAGSPWHMGTCLARAELVAVVSWSSRPSPG